MSKPTALSPSRMSSPPTTTLTRYTTRPSAMRELFLGASQTRLSSYRHSSDLCMTSGGLPVLVNPAWSNWYSVVAIPLRASWWTTFWQPCQTSRPQVLFSNWSSTSRRISPCRGVQRRQRPASPTSLKNTGTQRTLSNFKHGSCNYHSWHP